MLIFTTVIPIYPHDLAYTDYHYTVWLATLYLKVWDAASVAHAGEWFCCFTVIKLFHVRSEDQGGAFTADGFVERRTGISSSNIVSTALRGHQLQDILNNHALVTDLTNHHHHHQEMRCFCRASPPCGHRAAGVAVCRGALHWSSHVHLKVPLDS